MRITELLPWLRPTLLAPWLAMTVYVTIGVLLGHTDPLLGGRLGNWLAAMTVGSAWTAALSALLVGVDVLRARRGVPPPKGAPAWLGGAATFGICLGLYSVFPPSRWGTPWWWLAVLAPALAAAVVARIVTWRPGPTG